MQAQDSAAHYNITAQHGTAQHSTAQHSTAPAVITNLLHIYICSDADAFAVVGLEST